MTASTAFTFLGYDVRGNVSAVHLDRLTTSVPASRSCVVDQLILGARSHSALRLFGGAGSPVVVVQQPGQQLGQPLSLLG
jgi:hypothetical protein